MVKVLGENDRRILKEAMAFAVKSSKPLGDGLADDMRAFFRDAAKPRVMGVSRDPESPQIVLVHLSGPLGDDQLRDLHEMLRAFPA